MYAVLYLFFEELLPIVISELSIQYGLGGQSSLRFFPPTYSVGFFLRCTQSTPLKEGPYPIGHPESVGITTGLHRRTGGGAYRTGGISIGEKNSLLGQTVHIGCAVKVRTLATQSIQPISSTRTRITFGLAFPLAASAFTEQKRRLTTDSKTRFLILLSLSIRDIRCKLITIVDSKNFIHL